MSRIPIRLPGPKSKYGNKRTQDKKYASGREAKRAFDLKLMEKMGEITDLKEQVRFELIPNQFDGLTGKHLLERKIDYIADFVYRDRLDFKVVEDTKGFRSKEYIIKRKLMLFCHGIRVQEI